MNICAWKECGLLDELDPEKVSEILNLVGSMLEHMEVISLREAGLLGETLRTALEKGVTHYDSAYFTVAGKKGEVLASDDRTLREVAAKADAETASSAQTMEEVS